MCGFVGIINYTKTLEKQKETIIQMNNTMKNRGPDEEGFYIDDFASFGHKRLSIRDLKNGKQPMIEKYEYHDYVIVFNGQIYNTEELKHKLQVNGFEVNTTSDTEILLKSYLLYKEDVVHHLNGIFSFAVWNTERKELFLARDHFGIKPLFFTEFDNSFIFASELKAIFEYPTFQKIVNKEGICELFGIGPAHTPRKNCI